LIDDHINLQGGSPLAFRGVEQLGTRFTDMSAPYDQQSGRIMQEIAKENGFPLHKGVYVAVVGPQLETRAEYRFLRTIGADAVGMSTVPEVIVANHLKIPIAAVSVLTDEGNPDDLKPVDIQDIIETAGKAEPQMITLFRELIKRIELKPAE
ncbi:MAG: purine-nucleoside phosphorylase, partial [Salinimicrobium sediminis]|nr:purine-nucleoside phosphorylase [Salinimicrobium sediminis]